jgi:hypothetical protein
MLWFFAVGAAIGVALWVAVRFEDGLVPARDRAARATGQPRRCPCRRRPPAERCRRGCRGMPTGWQPRMPHADARSSVVHRREGAVACKQRRLSRRQPRPARRPRTAARQRVPAPPGT